MSTNAYLVRHIKKFLHEPERCRAARVNKTFALDKIPRRPGFGTCSICGDWADCKMEWNTIDRGHPYPDGICWHEEEISHSRFMSLVHGAPLCGQCVPKVPDTGFHYYNYVTAFWLPRYIDVPYRYLGLPGRGSFRYSVPRVCTSRWGWHLHLRNTSGARLEAYIYRTSSNVCCARFCRLVILAAIVLVVFVLWSCI